MDPCSSFLRRRGYAAFFGKPSTSQPTMGEKGADSATRAWYGHDLAKTGHTTLQRVAHASNPPTAADVAVSAYWTRRGGSRRRWHSRYPLRIPKQSIDVPDLVRTWRSTFPRWVASFGLSTAGVPINSVLASRPHLERCSTRRCYPCPQSPIPPSLSASISRPFPRSHPPAAAPR